MDRGTFAERVRLQLLSRYRGSDVEVDTSRFALHVTGSGIDLMLPLAPLLVLLVRGADWNYPKNGMI